MTRTYNLKNHPYSQCHITETEDKLVFTSYETDVIICDRKAQTIECTGTYSQTTRKQIGWFLKEYAPELCYAQMRDIAGVGPVPASTFGL